MPKWATFYQAAMVPTHADVVRPEFDPRTEAYVVHHDSDSAWNVSTTLVLSLGSLTDDDPREMRPLGHAVDPEALDSHVRGGGADATLSFEFHHHSVTVRSDGRIEFAPLRDTDHRSPALRV